MVKMWWILVDIFIFNACKNMEEVTVWLVTAKCKNGVVAMMARQIIPYSKYFQAYNNDYGRYIIYTLSTLSQLVSLCFNIWQDVEKHQSWHFRNGMLTPVQGLVSADTRGIVDADERRWFWISWKKNVLNVGRGNQLGRDIILSYSPVGIVINRMSLTSWNVPVSWLIRSHVFTGQGEKAVDYVPNLTKVDEIYFALTKIVFSFAV